MPIIIGKGISQQQLHDKHEQMHGKGFEAPCYIIPIKKPKPQTPKKTKLKWKHINIKYYINIIHEKIITFI